MRGNSQTARLAGTITGAAVLLLGVAHAPLARAETVVVDNQVQVAKSDVARPTGGMTMKSVEQHFGAPRERHATVGAPPITRWDYEHFAVFFEKDRVIDAVVLPTPTSSPAEASPSSATPPADAATPTTTAPAAASAPATSAPSAPAASTASTSAPG